MESYAFSVTLQGETYVVDPGKLRLTELYALKEKTGLKAGPWLDELQDLEPDSLRFLAWLVWTRAGKAPEWEAIDFTLDEIELERVKDPTPAPTPGETSGDGAASTSDSSPTSSTSRPETTPAA